MTPYHVETLVMEACEARGEEQYDIAETLYKTILMYDPDHRYILHTYSNFLLEREAYTAAINYATHAIQKGVATKGSPFGSHSVVGKAYLGLAKRYPEMETYYKEKAKPYLDTVLQIIEEKNFMEGWGYRFFLSRLSEYVHILETYGEENDALSYALLAIEKYPEKAGGYLLVSEILMLQGSHADALQCLNQAQLLEMENPNVYKALANYYSIVEEDDEKVEAFLAKAEAFKMNSETAVRYY